MIMIACVDCYFFALNLILVAIVLQTIMEFIALQGQMIVLVVRIKSYVVMGLVSAMIKMGLNVYANRYVCFFFFSIFGKTINSPLIKY